MRKGTSLSFEQLADPAGLSASELDTIDKDVRRTDGITKYLGELRKILIAWARLGGKGYTQGMNLIGGVLLRLLATFRTAKKVGNIQEVDAGSCSQNITVDRATLMGLEHLRSILPDDLPIQLSFGVVASRIGPLSFGRRSCSALLTDKNVGSE